MIKQFYSFLRRSFKTDSYQFRKYSTRLNRDVIIDVLLPERFRFYESYPMIIFNDGQDFPALGIEATLKKMYKNKEIKDAIIVGVHCNENRMNEYGTIEADHYSGYGSLAAEYSWFIINELLPTLRNQYNIKKGELHIAGFSLGALSALNIAWHNPKIFHKVGIFSASLWWRNKPFDKNNPDADRIMIDALARGPKREGLEFWFQVGTHDETDDRNNNGVIDAIDDTKDAINILLSIGYRLEDIRYTEIQGGEHNQKTWGEAMPDFLSWVLK